MATAFHRARDAPADEVTPRQRRGRAVASGKSRDAPFRLRRRRGARVALETQGERAHAAGVYGHVVRHVQDPRTVGVLTGERRHRLGRLEAAQTSTITFGASPT